MSDDIAAYTTCFSGFVQMLPNEVFLQITNLDSDIAFAGNILIELINQCQEVVATLELNENIFIEEFTDINGIRQIAYEFGNLGEDFGQELLHLKLTHTVSDSVWYSNAFQITYHLQEETTRFDYKNENYFRGISYDKKEYFQSIRLQCFRNDVDSNIESEEYVQMSGAKLNLRPIITPIEKYIFYMCDSFTFNRVVTLLNHDFIYINGYKITNKPVPTKGERIPDSNVFELTFETNPAGYFRDFVYQIYVPFGVMDRFVPHLSVWSLDGYNVVLPSFMRIIFNKSFQVNSSFQYKLYKNGVLVLTSSDYTSIGNVLNLTALSAYTFTVGEYAIVVDPNGVTSGIEQFEGFSITQWNYQIALGYYSSTYYDINYYLTD